MPRVLAWVARMRPRIGGRGPEPSVPPRENAVFPLETMYRRAISCDAVSGATRTETLHLPRRDDGKKGSEEESSEEEQRPHGKRGIHASGDPERRALRGRGLDAHSAHRSHQEALGLHQA